MRKITKNAINAFMNGQNYSESNTKVKVLPNVTVLILFGNEIAYRYNDPNNTLSITNCGYATNTTKERLNGIPGVNINQKTYVWFLNGKQWNGELIDINQLKK